MASLNNIADQIADAKGKSMDFPFKQRIKQVFIQQVATYIKQQLDKGRKSDLFVHYYLADLIKTDIVDECSIELGCTVLRTTNKIYRPLRFNGASPFEYVGDVNGTAYTEAKLMYKNEVNALPYMKNVIKYDYRNEYIYIWISSKITKLKIGMVPEDLRTFLSDCQTNTCWNDDMDLPIPMDMIQLVKERLFQMEFKIDASETDIQDINMNKAN